MKAARAVFAKHGRDAQMDDIARRAKVGVGTVYRHFPTKEALLEALAEDRFRQLAVYARGRTRDRRSVGGARGVRASAAPRCTPTTARSRRRSVSPPGVMRSAATRPSCNALIEQLVDAAQAAGVLRADARWEDVPMTFCAPRPRARTAARRRGSGCSRSSWTA